MEITLNGKTYRTSAADMFELRAEVYAQRGIDPADAAKFIWIVDGFQTEDNVTLTTGMTVNCIEKGVLPSREELESMLCARHTPQVHARVKEAWVAIAGLGGLGSNIAIMLARTGVGHLHLIDFDIVEPSNLNRQQYFIEHLGMYKTEALKGELARINPYVEVAIDTVKISPTNASALFADDDIICEAFDKPDMKAMLVDAVLTLPEKKLICGSGMAGYGASNTIKTRQINDRLYICGDGETGAQVGCGLMAPRVSICAAHEANLALQLILGGFINGN